jgi:hypothetical protein
VIHCGTLSPEEILWWKRLWYHGLGEFFYCNHIDTDFTSFVDVQCETSSRQHADCEYHSRDLRLVPVGGGKDSCVTLEFLRQQGSPLLGFTVNDQPARLETFLAAGFSPSQLLRTHRRIDSALLARNAEGFWNGHTPFSAIVAFLGLYCAYLVGAGELVLSNEASANEASVPGTQINHQYSKSYAFEQDMNAYVQRRFGLPVRYFSLLRPFSELQIARQFAALPQFHELFKSCSVGSKENVWCGKCAKCLFVALMLGAFLPLERVVEIFRCDIFADLSLAEELRALLGQSETKPFECVGTVEEAHAALTLILTQLRQKGKSLPALFQSVKVLPLESDCVEALLRQRNLLHNVPESYHSALERMFAYVRSPVGASGP